MTKGTDKTETGKRFFWRLHHWVGLYTGILIGVLSITGAVAVFIPEIDALIQEHHYNAVSTASSSGLPQFGESVDSLVHRFPDYHSLAISLPHQPNHAVQVDLITPEGGTNMRYDFFIDGGTDQFLGQRDHQNSLANYLRQMHVRLYEGYWGRQLVGIGGLALAVVAITGLVIYGNFMKRQVWPAVRSRKNIRIVMADWHKLVGISALAFNLVIALTGAWLGLQPWLMRWLDITTPNRYAATATVLEPAADRALAVDWPAMLDAAKKEFPDLLPRRIVPSTNGSATVTISGNITGAVYERDINYVILSKTDYRPVFKYDVRQQPLGHKFYFIQEALHFGDFGGLWLKALYALLGLTSGFLSISGFVIYLFRRKKKKPHKANALKTTFVYSMVSILFLTIIALISLFIGYTQASFVAGIIINVLLVALIGYALARYLIHSYRRRNEAASIQ